MWEGEIDVYLRASVKYVGAAGSSKRQVQIFEKIEDAGGKLSNVIVYNIYL